MIVTEYNGHTQGFLVEAVDTILRLDWSQMKVPPDMLTAAWAAWSPRSPSCRRPPGDAARRRAVLAETTPDDEFLFKIKPIGRSDALVLFADDSSVARRAGADAPWSGWASLSSR
jgi:two-component system chemotaxis response regulator CheV